MKKIKSVAITGRIHKASAVEAAKRTMAFLEKKRVRFEVDSFFPIGNRTRELNQIKADMVLCFGGDGSLLHTFHALKKSVPVLGVNCGGKGKLMAVQKENVPFCLEKMLQGKYAVEKRARLDVFADGVKKGTALNEAIIVPEKPGRLLRYHLVIEKDELGPEADDGIIIATPTGSTAHALSSGGPEVSPSAQVFVIVRMNPLDLNRRPLVVNDHKKIKITRFHTSPVEIVIDGQLSLKAEKEVLLRKGKPALLAVPMP
ncbi:MAG: NAD(+)/NADH kinase [Candidatus Diapherotrites archaeon]|nr:NAD(+)/NADH kinase [Candidatus Diapherotrites archaeon]